HRELQRTAGAGRRCLEALVGGNRVVGQNAAVTPSPDAQAGRIGNAFTDRPVHAREQVHDLQVAPVGVDGLLVSGPPAGAAAVVHLQDGVAAGGKDLPDRVERVVVLPVGATVDPQDERQ